MIEMFDEWELAVIHTDPSYTLTTDAIEKLAEHYHQQECKASHEDQCGWYHENSPKYPSGAVKWAHKDWMDRVPGLVRRDLASVRRILAVIKESGYDPVHQLRDPQFLVKTPRPSTKKKQVPDWASKDRYV